MAGLTGALAAKLSGLPAEGAACVSRTSAFLTTSGARSPGSSRKSYSSTQGIAGGRAVVVEAQRPETDSRDKRGTQARRWHPISWRAASTQLLAAAKTRRPAMGVSPGGGRVGQDHVLPMAGPGQSPRFPFHDRPCRRRTGIGGGVEGGGWRVEKRTSRVSRRPPMHSLLAEAKDLRDAAGGNSDPRAAKLEGREETRFIMTKLSHPGSSADCRQHRRERGLGLSEKDPE